MNERHLSRPRFIVALIAAALAAAQPAFAQKKTDYFVDESKLPFTALAGATAYWGVHGGAGYRAEYVVLDPSAVADPLYGCNFTNGAQLFGTPCP